jgi:hypothetical protein
MTAPDPLAALGAHLGASGFMVELTACGLKVTNPRTAGCCEEVARASDTIVCRRRAEDGGTLWFFTSSNEPVAPAERIVDAKVFILGYLAECHGMAEGWR